MEETSSLTNSIRWIIEHKIRIVFLAIGFILITLFINFFTSNAFVSVSVSASFDTKDTVIYAASAGPTQKIGDVGLLIVPRSTTSLIASNGDYIKTESKVDIPWYGFTEKKIQLQSDKNATKVAYKSTAGADCATYDSKSDQLAYYRCDNPNSLVVYKTPSTGMWHSQSIATPYYPNGQVLPYLGGVIGISDTYTEDAEETISNTISVIDRAGRTYVYDMPDDIGVTNFNFARLFTNTNDQLDAHFILVTAEGDIYIGAPTGGKKVNYHHIQRPQNYNSNYNQTLCTFNSDTVYCYRGKTAQGDKPKNFDYSKITGSQITTYSITDKSESVTTLTSDLFAIDNFQSTSSGELYATYYKELYRLTKVGDKYETQRVSQNANYIAGGDKLYYIQDSGIYAVDSRDSTTAHQVFYSKNIVPKSLYAVSGKLFIIGTAANDSSTTYAYLLGSEDDVTPGNRLIDVFPMANEDLTGTLLNDLVDDKLFVVLDITYDKDAKQPIESGEVEEKKNQALNILSGYQAVLSPENIRFTY